MKLETDRLWEILPESKDWLKQRLDILHLVSIRKVAGRRVISQDVGISERKVRNETQILEQRGLLVQLENGLSITPKGKQLLRDFRAFRLQVDAMAALSQEVQSVLGIKRVIVVQNQGNAIDLMANSTVRLLEKMLKETKILGITGGSSVASVVKHFPRKDYLNIQVVAARGSIGSRPEHQANTIGSALAAKLGAEFYPLFTPDVLSQQTVTSLKREPAIVKTVDKISKIDTLLFGIGRADEMARRREVSESYFRNLMEQQAKAESFGYYFDDQGKVIDQISTFGINLDHFKGLKRLIAIAYGREKAEAIESVCHINRHLTLVTDESCARDIVKKRGGKHGKSRT